ncbi:MAG: hypothetical protein JKY52_19885 [Flavobacteriales bacterium]|nr:hypothetical protein [Flavobacteriales bacterium]
MKPAITFSTPAAPQPPVIFSNVSLFNRKKMASTFIETRFDTDKKKAKWPGPIVWLSSGDRFRLVSGYTLTIHFSNSCDRLMVSVSKGMNCHVESLTPAKNRKVVAFGVEFEIIAKQCRANGYVARYAIWDKGFYQQGVK